MSRPNLTHQIKKGKVKIIEGTANFAITFIVSPTDMSCQCTDKATKGTKPLCDHLKYYLCECLGIRQQYLPVLSVPRVRTWIKNLAGKVLNVDVINQYCYNFLLGKKLHNNHEEFCCICHMEYCDNFSNPNTGDLYQCPSCFELYHSRCFSRWNKECPRCKYITGLGSNDVNWPSLMI